MTEDQYPIFDEVPVGQRFPGRTPTPRPWVTTIKKNPRKWVLIETHAQQESKKAYARANSHRLWAKQNKYPIEVISRTAPANWDTDDAEFNPSDEVVGLVFARWFPPSKGTRKRK